MASNNFAISLTSTGLITLQLGTGSLTSLAANGVLSAGTWSLVTVSFILATFSTNTNLAWIYINGGTPTTSTSLAVGTITWTPSTDVVRVGGPSSFLGSIKELSIYSPGSMNVNSRTFEIVWFKITLF